MKLGKAIEILQDKNHVEYRSPDHDYRDALRLGIEALKEVKKAREGDPALDGELLPGEDPN